MDEANFLRLRQLTRDAKATGVKFPVSVGFKDEVNFPHSGTVEVTDPSVDPDHKRMRVRAVLPNPMNRIFPGQLARIRVAIGTRTELVVPKTAVFEAAYEIRVGDWTANAAVFAVTGDGFLVRKPVRAGAVEIGKRVIEAGLVPTDWVVENQTGRNERERINPQRGPAEKKSDPPPVPKPETPPAKPLPDFPVTGPALTVSASYPGEFERRGGHGRRPIDQQINGLRACHPRPRLHRRRDFKMTSRSSPGPI